MAVFLKPLKTLRIGRFMKVIGIDPGKKGCVVILDSIKGVASWLNMPFRPDGILDLTALNDALLPFSTAVIYLEKIHGRSGWGATSVFNFGVNYGQVLGWLFDKPHTLITPQKWQYVAHLGTSGESAKEKSYQSFIRLNPGSKVKKSHDGLVDAFHIARFGLYFHGVDFKDGWDFKPI